MNCTDTRNSIEGYVDGELDAGGKTALESHLRRCGACRAALERERAFRTILRSQPAPAPDPRFIRQAMHRAAHPKRGSGRTGAFAAGFASAAAAALAIWIAFAPAPQGTRGGSIPTVTLVVNESRAVNLVFESPAAFPDATLAMALPSHVELDGFPGQRRLQWQASLRRGPNLLSLPVTAVQAAEGELQARIAYGGREKLFRVRIEVQSGDGTA